MKLIIGVFPILNDHRCVNGEELGRSGSDLCPSSCDDRRSDGELDLGGSMDQIKHYLEKQQPTKIS